MNKTEAKKIIASMMVFYPNYNPGNIDIAADAWTSVMPEYSYAQVESAVRSYVRSNASGFAPVPGQIIEIINATTTPSELNEMEAWSLVSKAIRNSGYNSVEEFAKLPPIVQKAVGLPGQLRIWALDEDYNETVVSSNFLKCYRAEVKREQELQKMPPEIRQLIKRVNGDSYTAQIGQKRDETIENMQIERKALISAKNEATHGIHDTERYHEMLEDILGAGDVNGKHKI